MAGVQFVGKGPLMAAYEKVGASGSPWALFQGKKLRKAGIGGDELAEWLDIFCPAGSTAVYTLCVYDEDVETAAITAGTDCAVCWDFKLNEYRGGEGGTISGFQKRMQDHVEGILQERLDKLEKKLDEDDEDEKGFDFNKFIMGLLNNPEQLAGVIGAVKSLFAGGGAMAPAAAIGAFGQAQPASEEERYNRLAAVLERLEKDNPQLLQQLEKLADIKEKKPDTFKFLISNLGGI